MPDYRENIKVIDGLGFVHDLLIVHQPLQGFSTVYDRGTIVCQIELNRIHEPFGDDDREWEMYEDSFSEWRDEILFNAQRKCKEHFN